MAKKIQQLQNQHNLKLLPKKVQDPQGTLKQENNIQINQDPPGILTNRTPFQTTKETFESLPLNQIIPFEGIHDYVEQTTSIYPTVVKTPSNYYCIDGINLIETARIEKLEFIRCHALYISVESKIEIAIMKIAIRVVSDNGKPYYAELVRNCKKLLSLLIETTKNPVMHSHGGKRKGINYNKNNKEDNIRILLAERLGKSDSTINKYINYGENLNDTILNTLVQSKKGKKFFEAAASNKRRLIKNLKCDGKDEPSIIAEVSQKMSEWLMEFKDSGKIKPLVLENIQTPERKKCLIDPPKPFEHHEKRDLSQEEISKKSLHKEIQQILEALCGFVKDANSKDEEFTKIIKNKLAEIITRLNKYDCLIIHTSGSAEGEVA